MHFFFLVYLSTTKLRLMNLFLFLLSSKFLCVFDFINKCHTRVYGPTLSLIAIILFDVIDKTVSVGPFLTWVYYVFIIGKMHGQG